MKKIIENKFINKSFKINHFNNKNTSEINSEPLCCKINLNPGFQFVGFKDAPGIMITVTNPEILAANS